MKAITLAKTELNGKFYYEMFNGSAQQKNLDESEFLTELDHAIDNGYFITITKDSLATTIHEHCKYGDDNDDRYNDPLRVIVGLKLKTTIGGKDVTNFVRG